jgi:hypothetical protein
LPIPWSETHRGLESAWLLAPPGGGRRRGTDARSSLILHGRRDSLRPDPADPTGALAAVIAEAAAYFDSGPRRCALLALLAQIGVSQPSQRPPR